MTRPADRADTTVVLPLPSKAIYRPGESVLIDILTSTANATEHGAGSAPGTQLSATVHHFGELVATFESAGGSTVDLGPLPVGGYGIEIHRGPDLLARTAVEVLDRPRDRPRDRLRYGFVVDYSPGRDPQEVQTLIRRLHLTGVQFYDWAYRHADLLGAGHQDATYADALGQPVSLATVRALIGAVHGAGAEALGYAAVYGVGSDDWAAWAHDGLLTPSGTPYGLGDFLQLIDPAAQDWQAHFRADLAAATTHLGFDGFHLDQYGYPKHAVRADGTIVDVASSFDSLIRAVRHELPDSRLVFNNVNDFPTWTTTKSPQDATYIELWPPHVTLADLAAVVRRARSLAPQRPVVIAAYQSVYATGTSTETAELATAFTMATLFSHGATHLLAGEGGRILVDPYYVRNHVAADSTLEMLTRWYDFLVEHGELLMTPGAAEVTGAYVDSYNADLDVAYPAHRVTGDPVPGSIWRRVVSVDGRLVVHLINLAGQSDMLWDAPRQPPADTGAGTLRMRRFGPGLPRVRIADPDGNPRLVALPVTADGDNADYAVASLPPMHVWQMLLIDVEPTESAD